MAQLLVERSFDAQAFFCNSGAEANETAIKLARLTQGPERYKIITFQNSFHGRTFGALSATAQPKYHAGVGPMLAGFTYCPWGDLKAVAARIDDATAAIMIEPIQGEGGVYVPEPGYLQGLRDLCDELNLLLIFDEVQTGCGRTEIGLAISILACSQTSSLWLNHCAEALQAEPCWRGAR